MKKKMIIIRNIRKKLIDGIAFSKIFFGGENRCLHLAPPFLVEDYVPAAVKANDTGVLTVRKYILPKIMYCHIKDIYTPLMFMVFDGNFTNL